MCEKYNSVLSTPTKADIGPFGRYWYISKI